MENNEAGNQLYENMSYNQRFVAAYLCGFYSNKEKQLFEKYKIFRNYIYDTFKTWMLDEEASFIYGVEHSCKRKNIDLNISGDRKNGILYEYEKLLLHDECECRNIKTAANINRLRSLEEQGLRKYNLSRDMIKNSNCDDNTYISKELVVEVDNYIWSWNEYSQKSGDTIKE